MTTERFEDFDGEQWIMPEQAHRDDREFTEFIAEREFESRKEMLRLLQIPFPRGQKSVQSPALQ